MCPSGLRRSWAAWPRAASRPAAALIGGETAEHPGMMPVDDYDLAGFSVGIVDKKKIIDNTRMRAGDVVIALASTGVHSNGFSPGAEGL